jgi:hypothetical protein
MRCNVTEQKKWPRYVGAAMLLVLAGCRQEGMPGMPKPATQAAAGLQHIGPLVVTNWGPQSTTPGVVPNRQPDGSLGIWIQATGTRPQMQVFFAGKAAKITTVQPNLITAAVDAGELRGDGVKDVAVKDGLDGKTYVIGQFRSAAGSR